MRTLKEIEEEVKEAGFEVSPFLTRDKWADKDGNEYYIDKHPINWATISKNEEKLRNEKN